MPEKSSAKVGESASTVAAAPLSASPTPLPQVLLGVKDSWEAASKDATQDFTELLPHLTSVFDLKVCVASMAYDGSNGLPPTTVPSAGLTTCMQ